MKCGCAKAGTRKRTTGVRFARTPPKATPGLLAIIPAAARFLRLPVVLHMLALRPAS